MIRPTKYMDLETSVVNVSASMLERVLYAGAVPLDELRAVISRELGERANHNFLPALNLLFLFGLVDYSEGGDAIFATGRAK